MDELILHPRTKALLENYVNEPSHAICLFGPAGAGKSYISQTIANTVLGGKLADNALVLQPSLSIGIEQIRELQSFLRLVRPGKAAIKRAVIIEQADRMTDEAQNALLKSLEEPPADTIFILTTDGTAGLKPTIYSRVQIIRVLPLTEAQAKEAFSEINVDLKRIYSLSGGYAGLLYGLLHDPDHQLVSAVQEAKTLIQASIYDRLLSTDRIAKEKDSLPTLLYALERVVGAATTQTKNVKAKKRLIVGLRSIYQARINIQRNANPKLLLTDLFLSL